MSHYTAKFDRHRHCDGRDIMFLVVEEQDATYSLKSAITVYLCSTRHIMLSPTMEIFLHAPTKFQKADIANCLCVNEIRPRLIIRDHNNNWQNKCKILFSIRSKTILRKRKRKKKERQLQSFLCYTQTWCSLKNKFSINPLLAKVPILYPLKTTRKLKVFLRFQGI